ncbi:MAG: serine hydrolase [Tissierellia bacterium]|nr:serine hydrolase [Tissierellia bacterium]
MNDLEIQEIESLLDRLPGQVSVYYEDLEGEDSFSYQTHLAQPAASTIKVPILVALLNEISQGSLDLGARTLLREEDKVPSCGALAYMDEGLEVTLKDLYTLMIIHSDNTATNLLIDKLGLDKVNRLMEDLGLAGLRLNRKLFDEKAQAAGLENYVTARDLGRLLKDVYQGYMLDPKISQEIRRVLSLQRLNAKIPYLLPKGVEVAHKTGEDEGITHDVGIVYSKKPFIFCFLSSQTDPVVAEDVLRKLALLFYKKSLT